MPHRNTTNTLRIPELVRLPTLAAIAALSAAALLVGCGGSEPQAEQAQAQEPAFTLSDLEAAKPVAVTPEQVAETFALGSKSTDLQRELLEKEVSGQVVEWNLQLYEVSLDGDVYTVSTQPVPIADGGTVNLIRIIADVRARTPEEHAFLRAVKTGDPIRLRGRLTAIALRTAVVLDPAVIVMATEAAK